MAQHAAEVVSFDAGSGANSTYTDPQAVLGAAPTDTGEFMGDVYYVTPFNAPYDPSANVSLGAGGSLTLRMANYIMPVDGQPELGVMTYQMLDQDGWPDGGAGTTATLFRTSQQAVVEVSEDGLAWSALNGGNVIAMDIPANAFQDRDATMPSDDGLPFTGTIGSFDGTSTVEETLAVYGGSAGGTWLDMSATGLSKVGYVRFSVPVDAAASFELESLTTSTQAVGTTVPEPATMSLLGLGALAILKRRRQR
ncbi:MAG: PEP-CTERM sorting domain-containing protein [Planctomycetes bacterium]|jgi:hypothetical protein|nr:PEP-CTERM sorting domain-containing protein [Planctomycetota bacterium]